MQSIRAVIAVSIAVLLVLWWGVQPPRYQPERPRHDGGRCPGNSELQDKLCVCAKGSAWNGNACVARGV